MIAARKANTLSGWPVETLAVTALLVLLHSLLAKLATRFRPLATLLKGKPRTLAKDGEIDWSAMRDLSVGRRDLLAAVRQAGDRALDEIGLAMLERGGDIEVVLADKSAESRDHPETDCR